jgi:gluconate 5-dehydrogenase
MVTGGASGMGKSEATIFAREGAKVMVADMMESDGRKVVSEIVDSGGQAQFFRLDVTKESEWEAAVAATVAAFGKLDILVNNAGATWGAPAEDTPLEAWQKLVNLNLTGTFLVTQSVGRRSMIPRRYGRIVNVASVAGLQGSLPERMRSIAYNTTKGGVVNFTRALAGEWGQYGITVNAICPGFFPSKMTHATLEKIADRVIAEAPLRRLGGDEDLKGIAALFASDAAQHITGQIVAVDGGSTVV